MKEEWKKVLREYCYKNGIEYPYSAEEDLGYNPGSEPAPVPGPGQPGAQYDTYGGGYAPHHGGGYHQPPGGYNQPPANYGPPPGGFAPAPTYHPPATDPTIYPNNYNPSGPAPDQQPYNAHPAADYSNPDVPPPKDSYNNGGGSGKSGYPSSSGYSLPPAPSDLELPKYNVDSKKPGPPQDKKPEPSKKPAQDDDDSDDEDLMSRLRNLQK